MKRPNLSNVSMPDVPDASDVADGLLGLVETAADAGSSAAGPVPGLDDYRAATRRRNMMMTFGAIAAVLVLVAYLKRRSSHSELKTAQSDR